MSTIVAAHLVPAAYITGQALYAQAKLQQAGQPRAAKVADIKTLNELYKHFSCSATNLREGRTYTLASNALLHGGLGHLIFNGFGLWSFGTVWASPSLAGNFWFLPVFWGGVVAGNVTSLALEGRTSGDARFRRTDNINRSHIGMSGGVMSLGGAVAAVVPRMTVSLMGIIPMPMWAFTGLFAGWSVLADSNELQPSVDHMGHLGGLAFGLTTGLLLRGRIRAKWHRSF